MASIQIQMDTFPFSASRHPPCFSLRFSDQDVSSLRGCIGIWVSHPSCDVRLYTIVNLYKTSLSVLIILGPRIPILQTNGSLGPCDGCTKRKHPQAPFPTSYSRAKKILHRLHMDLQGPFNTSIKGYRYVLTVVDDHSRLGWKKFLKLKSDTSGEIKALITELENYTGWKVKIIWIDSGGEFADDELREWFKSKGITLEILAPDTQQQNGVAERFNQTTHEHGLSMLKEAGITNGFWPEAHQYSNYACNWSPTKALTRTTPYEVFYKKKPDVSTLHIFGSCCHICIPKDKCKKLDAHSIDGGFCGFTDQHKAYHIWIPSCHKFMTSWDFIVYEKLPKHEIEPIITSASGKGVILSESTTSKPNNQIVVHQQTLRQLDSLGSSVQTAIGSQKSQLGAGQDSAVQARTLTWQDLTDRSQQWQHCTQLVMRMAWPQAKSQGQAKPNSLELALAWPGPWLLTQLFETISGHRSLQVTKSGLLIEVTYSHYGCF